MKNGKRILVVEDDPMFAELLSLWIERNGFTVCAVTADPDQAVSIARSQRPDICLIDLFLPDAPLGYDAACEILERVGTPVIVMSARPPEELVVPCLAKPFTEAELVATLHKTLQQDIAAPRATIW